MDRLPTEMIRMVFSFLKAPDIGNFRRTAQLYANAGRSRLYHELHLMFTPDSFERLHAISTDPELACYVTSLFYEADTLPHRLDQHDWELRLDDDLVPPWLDSMDPPSPKSSSKRAHRAYRRELRQLEEFKVNRFQKFLGYSEQQRVMRKDFYCAEKIAAAISRLPNLVEVFFSLEQWARPRTNAMRNAFGDGLVIPFGHNSWREPRGVPQMLTLCLASALMGKKLKTLWGGIIDWKFWKQSDAAFEDLQKGVQNIEELVLEFSTCPGGKIKPDEAMQDEIDKEIRECADHLKDGRLLKFLAAASNLRILDLRFESVYLDWFLGFPANLRDVVGKHHWDRLTDVTLNFFSSSEEDLIDFCKSHAMTLQRLVISEIFLFKGSWLSTFSEIRCLLRLERVRICGRLVSIQDSTYRPELNECWDFPEIGTRAETTMGHMVQEYLLQGGNGPRLDLHKYHDLNYAELKELRDGLDWSISEHNDLTSVRTVLAQWVSPLS